MSSAFEIELGKCIDEDIERLRACVEAPMGVQHWADYKFLVGQIFALRRVLDSHYGVVNKLINER